MLRRVTILVCLSLLLLAVTASAMNKSTPQATRVENPYYRQLRLDPRMVAADTCVIASFDSIMYQIDNWVIGDEIYKAYMDPASSCSNPYPFTITEVHFFVSFAAGTAVSYGADIEAVNLDNPSCPFPDSLLNVTTTYQDVVPEAGLWDLWVPLDEPLVVNGPFFAGFYLGGGMDPASAPAVITDDNPIQCTSYNIWDEAVGFIDLNDNTYWIENFGMDWNFPGRLAMAVVGYSGSGGPTQPEPEVSLLWPPADEALMGSTDLWAVETSGSEIVDYVSFEYYSGGTWNEIGRDFDGTSPLRDGTSPVVAGMGFDVTWNMGTVAEGNYMLRALVYDTLARFGADTVTVFVEPTPPIPTILSPDNGTAFCDPLDLLMFCPDENLSYIEVRKENASYNYSCGMTTANVNILGNEYTAPGAVALAMQMWSDRGYTYLMREDATYLSVVELAVRLAGDFNTVENSGTYDEDLWQGLWDFSYDRSNTLTYDYMRNPDYFTLRTWVEYDQKAVIIALSGNPGMWLAVDGFKGLAQPDGSYLVTVSNPLTGSLIDAPLRNNMGTSEMQISGTWRPVDMMVSVMITTFSVNHPMLGADFSGSDGWSYSWIPTGVTEDSLYIFEVSGRDAGSLRGTSTVLLQYSCSGAYTIGDYDNDGDASIMDLVYLTQFLTANGPPPVGGAERADANGDGYVNVADLVYYMNYAFGSGSEPHH